MSASALHTTPSYEQLPTSALPSSRQITRRLLAVSLAVLLLSVYADYAPEAIRPAHFVPLTAKRSLLNRYGIKLAWLHTTWVWALVTAVSLFTAVPKYRLPTFLTLLHPYVFSTVFWVLMTQSIPGVYTSFIDSLFLRSGGGCQVDGERLDGIINAAACSVRRGQWTGGHDVSGHVFLLLLSMTLLLQTSWRSAAFARKNRHLLSTKDHGFYRTAYAASRTAVYSLMALWMLGLSVTSLYYHHFFEKLNAVIIVNAFYFLVYHLFGI
ncbi:hypothetical protein RI367_004054 [Sorochytrium milnesiophthora]